MKYWQLRHGASVPSFLPVQLKDSSCRQVADPALVR
jgi:hypothetical protein